MKTYRVFYEPKGSKVLVALIPAETLKSALTHFKAAGFDGVVRAVIQSDFDSSLFNL